jgi:hypothetical protein
LLCALFGLISALFGNYVSFAKIALQPRTFSIYPARPTWQYKRIPKVKALGGAPTKHNTRR